MNSPFFSIITACKNAEFTIEQTLESVVAQTFTNYEHVCIYGSSDDATGEIIERYVANNPQSMVITDKATGFYSALNQGIQASTGKYILALNADDVLASSTVLEKIRARLEVMNDSPDVFGCNVIMSDENENVIRYFESVQGSLRFGWMPPHPGLVIRRRVFQKVGYYDDDFKVSADYEFILRMISRKKGRERFSVCNDQTIISHRMQPGGLSSNRWQGLCEDFQIAKKYFPLMFPFVVFLKKLRKIKTFLIKPKN